MLCSPLPVGLHGRDRRRDAIVAAARTLATEHGPHGFTVEAVASLAGVSRRTVFNHFAGVEQLLVAVCEQVLGEVTSELLLDVDRRTAELPGGDAARRTAYDAVHEATRDVDLPAAIVTVHHALGGPLAPDERVAAIKRTAFEHVVERLRVRLQERVPDLDPVDLELSLNLLTHGLATVAGRWLEQHPDLTHDVPEAARADWDLLLDRLLHHLRAGYAG